MALASREISRCSYTTLLLTADVILREPSTPLRHVSFFFFFLSRVVRPSTDSLRGKNDSARCHYPRWEDPLESYASARTCPPCWLCKLQNRVGKFPIALGFFFFFNEVTRKYFVQFEKL